MTSCSILWIMRAIEAIDSGRRRGLRRRDAVAGRDQLARVEVDGGRLDPAPADVHADRQPSRARVDRATDGRRRLVLVVLVTGLGDDRGDGLRDRLDMGRSLGRVGGFGGSLGVDRRLSSARSMR